MHAHIYKVPIKNVQIGKVETIELISLIAVHFLQKQRLSRIVTGLHHSLENTSLHQNELYIGAAGCGRAIELHGAAEI